LRIREEVKRVKNKPKPDAIVQLMLTFPDVPKQDIERIYGEETKKERLATRIKIIFKDASSLLEKYAKGETMESIEEAMKGALVRTLVSSGGSIDKEELTTIVGEQFGDEGIKALEKLVDEGVIDVVGDEYSLAGETIKRIKGLKPLTADTNIKIDTLNVSGEGAVKFKEQQELAEGETMELKRDFNPKSKTEKKPGIMGLAKKAKEDISEIMEIKEDKSEDLSFGSRVISKTNPIKGTVLEVTEVKPGDVDILVLWDKPLINKKRLVEVDPTEIEPIDEEATPNQLEEAKDEFAKYRKGRKEHEKEFEEKVEQEVLDGLENES
jgi:hypothetical protein